MVAAVKETLDSLQTSSFCNLEADVYRGSSKTKTPPLSAAARSSFLPGKAAAAAAELLKAAGEIHLRTFLYAAWQQF